MKRRNYLLDMSFLIDYETEVAAGVDGPARRTMSEIKHGRLYVSPVTPRAGVPAASEVP